MKQIQKEQEFTRRFARHADELKWLFCELYHGDMAAYERFVQMLRQAYDARPEALRVSDRRREQDPDWYRGNHLTGMLMYVDCFAGTLRGVQEKLEHDQAPKAFRGFPLQILAAAIVAMALTAFQFK